MQWSARANRIPLIARPGAVGVRIWFLFERPKSAPATERPFMTVKPDIDKVLRAALDALTGLAYEDDAQVVEVQTIKRYSTRTETILQIWEER